MLLPLVGAACHALQALRTPADHVGMLSGARGVDAESPPPAAREGDRSVALRRRPGTAPVMRDCVCTSSQVTPHLEGFRLFESCIHTYQRLHLLRA